MVVTIDILKILLVNLWQHSDHLTEQRHPWVIVISMSRCGNVWKPSSNRPLTKLRHIDAGAAYCEGTKTWIFASCSCSKRLFKWWVSRLRSYQGFLGWSWIWTEAERACMLDHWWGQNIAWIQKMRSVKHILDLQFWILCQSNVQKDYYSCQHKRRDMVHWGT